LEKLTLASSLPCDLNRSTTNIPNAYRIANLAFNYAMILPYDANPGRIELSERTVPKFPFKRHARFVSVEDN
jgi:hypothetical protein